jgi:hypothetical protein
VGLLPHEIGDGHYESRIFAGTRISMSADGSLQGASYRMNDVLGSSPTATPTIAPSSFPSAIHPCDLPTSLSRHPANLVTDVHSSYPNLTITTSKEEGDAGFCSGEVCPSYVGHILWPLGECNACSNFQMNAPVVQDVTSSGPPAQGFTMFQPNVHDCATQGDTTLCNSYSTTHANNNPIAKSVTTTAHNVQTCIATYDASTMSSLIPIADAGSSNYVYRAWSWDDGIAGFPTQAPGFLPDGAPFVVQTFKPGIDVKACSAHYPPPNDPNCRTLGTSNWHNDVTIALCDKPDTSGDTCSKNNTQMSKPLLLQSGKFCQNGASSDGTQCYSSEDTSSQDTHVVCSG